MAEKNNEILGDLTKVENNKDNGTDNLPLKWKKAKVVITGFATLAAILVPVIAAFISESITSSLKEKEMGHKYVELAVGVLKEKETSESINIRKWAQKIVDHYSPVKMSEEAKQEVLKVPLPGAVSYSIPAYRIPTEPRKIKIVILSDTGTPTAKSVINYMQSENVHTSYHYLIDTDGRLNKLVDERNIAFFAGRSHWKDLENLNQYAIGIGLVHIYHKDNYLKITEGHPALGPKYPVPQIDTLIDLLTNICLRYGIKPENIVTKQDVVEGKLTDLHGEELEKIRKAVEAKLKAE